MKIDIQKRFTTALRLLVLLVTDHALFSILLNARRQGITYLSVVELADLGKVVRRCEHSNVPGLLIEAGTALGGSALVMTAVKSPSRPINLYDTFEMIPPPSDSDGADAWNRYRDIQGGKAHGIAGKRYYGYETNLIERVCASFQQNGFPVEKNQVSLFRGLFQDTLKIDQPVAVAHIDCDWYDSVLTCLQAIAPNLSVGGTLVIDDYLSWSGCKTAVDEYFADRKANYSFRLSTCLYITRVK